jgi:hypothetical protein
MTDRKPHGVLPWSMAIIGMAFSPAALAYVDLSTGSMLIQALIGAVAVAGTLLKVYWTKLVGFLRRSGKEGASEERR